MKTKVAASRPSNGEHTISEMLRRAAFLEVGLFKEQREFMTDDSENQLVPIPRGPDNRVRFQNELTVE